MALKVLNLTCLNLFNGDADGDGDGECILKGTEVRKYLNGVAKGSFGAGRR